MHAVNDANKKNIKAEVMQYLTLSESLKIKSLHLDTMTVWQS